MLYVSNFVISDFAHNKIMQMKNNGNPSTVLRIAVTGGGCHGFQYVFSSEVFKSSSGDFVIFDKESTPIVVIDKKSVKLMSSDAEKDTVIDYKSDILRSEFFVTSARASSKCGCGNSFAIE